MKQLTLTTIPLLCAAFAPLCADAQGTKQCDAERTKCMEQAEKDRAARQNLKWTDAEMNHITPIADPLTTAWVAPYVTADFIYWKVKEDGLDYAFSGTTSDTPGHTTDDAVRGKMSSPRFRYEPGFKVGLGGKFRHDGWDLYAQYTWLHVNRKHHHHGSSSSSVQSNIMMPRDGQLITFFADEASATWSNRLNILDVELGRDFWISKRLTLRPFIGMKFDWTRQKFTADYALVDTGAVTDADITAGSAVSLSMRQHQWAVGLRTGLNTAWYMWRHFCIFGDIAISGMLNDFDVKRSDTIENLMGVEWIQNNLRKDTNPVTAVIEWALGLRYEMPFSDEKYLLQLQAGWEEQVWFNQNQFIFMPNSSPTDMNMQGLTIKAAFYF